MKQPPKLRRDQLIHPADKKSSFNGDKIRPSESQGFMARREAQGLTTDTSRYETKKPEAKPLTRTVIPTSQPPVMPCALSRRQEKMIHKK